MKTTIQPEWIGQDAFVIGGGASLRSFDFCKLKGRNTIGVNEAFRLGPEICKRVIYGDGSWWQKAKWNLEKYAQAGGIVYSVAPSLENFNLSWHRSVMRISSGLSTEPDRLAWNASTGAAAVNLAFLLGAQRIFLLGFDMVDVKGVTHWHNYHPRATAPSSFRRFQEGFRQLGMQLKKRPEVHVYNVTDGTSKLEAFEKISFEDMDRRLNLDVIEGRVCKS